jgi:hypothetical protein
MPWPSDQEYNEAIQNPAVAFADLELKSGQIELNSMGLPKARSGNFATVYKVVTTSTVYAVRCFRYDNPEHSIRYPAIASYLSQNVLPYMVSFRFMSQGIRIGPSWYPTVKMKWVEGESLVSYIEKNLSSHTALQSLASGWAQMLTDLQHANIAHGDLQHGNVLVVQGKLKLVDYDGMYVPALEGRLGIELGHRNYQHPQRTELDFGPHLDNLSAWLIYVSLVALAAQPTLWGQLKAGDECLLFRKEDLDAPDRSAAFRLLRAIPNPHVRNLADQIEHFLWLPPDQIPLVTDQSVESESAGINLGSIAPGASWISDYTKPVQTAASDDFPVTEAGDQTWVQDHVEQKIDLGSFVNRASVDRLMSIPVFLAVFGLCAGLSSARGPAVEIAIWIAGGGASCGVILACWRIRYRYEPVFGTILSARSDLSRLSKEGDAATQGLAELKGARLRGRDSYAAAGSRLQERQSALQADESKRLGEIDAALQAALQPIHSRLRATTAEEGAEKRKLLETIGGEIARLSRALVSLPDQERQEMARIDADLGAKVNRLAGQLQQTTARRDAELGAALKEYQDQIVNGHLHKFRIAEASIEGIGPQLKQRLAVAGYVSAADIGAQYSRVPGIGITKAAALHAWRNRLEGPIRLREAPKSLPSHKSANIEQRYEMPVRQLQQNLAGVSAK